MNSNSSQNVLSDKTVRLRAVAGRLESLIQQHLDEWDRLSDGGDDEQQREREDYQQLVRQLAAERDEFEQERDEERDRLIRDADRLADAWREFEHEQRELLKEQQLGRTRGGESSQTAPPQEVPDQTAVSHAAPVQTQAAPGYAPPNSNVAPAQQPAEQPAAQPAAQQPAAAPPEEDDPARAKSPTSQRQGVVQFQQLRREMMQHARQRKRR